jgi:thiamine-phosphate pyrophosphorylase
VTEPSRLEQLSHWGSGLYAIIDPEELPDRDPLRFAAQLLERGCAVLQLRHKRLDDATALQLALALKELCHGAGVPFVVNDRPDLALASGADGLHLGQSDMRVEDARALTGSMLLGVSTHSPSQARQAEQDGADLIGFGPVFPTQTKEKPDPVVGIEQLTEVCEAVAVPVVAIGGIDASRAAATLKAGARWVAAISALESLSREWPAIVGGTQER